MLANERREYIVKTLTEKGTVLTSDLCFKFGVSPETIRRDLLFLEKKMCLKKVHGGAISLTKMKEFKAVLERKNEFMKEKEEIAERAIEFIQDGDIIAIDSGSTADLLAEKIDKCFTNLTIVTHSLDVLKILNDSVRFHIILIGGQWLKSENSLYGPFSLSFLKGIHVAKSFVVPSAISLKSGIGDYIPELIPIQKEYIAMADEVYILSDHSKFEKTAFVNISQLKTNFTVITDSELNKTVYDNYIKNSINIIRGGTR